jgi:uncharacterized membrane protein YphA (DoxX/SURF4 family)
MRDRGARVEAWVARYARIALGAAFLSAVGGRLGVFGGHGFAAFEAYTAEVNSFLPAAVIPFIARVATVLELGLGVALVVGAWPRWVAYGAAILLAMFGLAMAISFGARSPLEYSVFSASACALLLATRGARAPARVGGEPVAPG